MLIRFRLFSSDLFGFDCLEPILEGQSALARGKTRGQGLVYRFDFGAVPRDFGYTLSLRIFSIRGATSLNIIGPIVQWQNTSMAWMGSGFDSR